jgi:hypothetical protein
MVPYFSKNYVCVDNTSKNAILFNHHHLLLFNGNIILNGEKPKKNKTKKKDSIGEIMNDLQYEGRET